MKLYITEAGYTTASRTSAGEGQLRAAEVPEAALRPAGREEPTGGGGGLVQPPGQQTGPAGCSGHGTKKPGYNAFVAVARRPIPAALRSAAWPTVGARSQRARAPHRPSVGGPLQPAGAVAPRTLRCAGGQDVAVVLGAVGRRWSRRSADHTAPAPTGRWPAGRPGGCCAAEVPSGRCGRPAPPARRAPAAPRDGGARRLVDRDHLGPLLVQAPRRAAPGVTAPRDGATARAGQRRCGGVLAGVPGHTTVALTRRPPVLEG